MPKTIVLLIAVLLGYGTPSYSQAGEYIKVHFLYGSKPGKEYKDSEGKWFGGRLGGHVGIEIDSNLVLDFVPYGELHLVAKKDERHSRFVMHTLESFWEIFGTEAGDVKKLTVVIPVSHAQRQRLDSIRQAYTRATPYDYALIGMRCGAAAYDVLAQLGIVPQYGTAKTSVKIFYPRKLRKRLIRKARQNGWEIIREEGTPRRKWEKDKPAPEKR